MKIYPLQMTPNIVAESPRWDKVQQTLYWIDAQQPVLLGYHITSKRLETWDLPAPLHCIDFNKNGQLVGIMKNSLVQLSFQSSKLTIKTLQSNLQENSKIDFNDGSLDAMGRLWVGSYDKKVTEPIANLFCFDMKGNKKIMDSDFICTNGLAWSPDQRTMYLAETFHNCIYAYDFDLQRGSIGNRRIFVKPNAGEGLPDGLIVDHMGDIWCAMWTGGGVHRYSADGTFKQKISVSARNTTSCCLAEEIKTIFITSATFDLEGETELGEDAGKVFCVELED